MAREADKGVPLQGRVKDAEGGATRGEGVRCGAGGATRGEGRASVATKGAGPGRRPLFLRHIFL